MDIVVVNYHTPGDLASLLQSLNRFPPMVPSTLTVVDVESESREETFKWSGGEGTTIGVEENIGYARACNMAAARNGDEIVAFFNADIEFTPYALHNCNSVLERNRDWAILGPCQVDRRNRIRHAGIFGTLETPVHRGWDKINRSQFNDVRDAVTVSGSAYFVKRSVWRELTDCPLFRDIAPEAEGAFLPTPHYYEETWASYHAHAHGYRVIYYGAATMIHKWHQASTVGGWAEQQMPLSRRMFREACDHHGIGHD